MKGKQSDKLIIEALEKLWGIDWKPESKAIVAFMRPNGFIVAERRISARDNKGYLVYLARKEGISSTRLQSIISKTMNSRAWILGLKDSNAITYQYLIVEKEAGPSKIEGPGYTAWLVGKRRKKPGLGAYLWNNFRLTIKIIMGDPLEVCNSLLQGPATGFYGPQRFGIKRPNTHLYGLYYLLNEPGALLREYMYTYPLSQGSPGGYEGEAVRRVRKTGDPLGVYNVPPPSIVREAIQSYIWNRAVSRILDKKGYPISWEKDGRALCPEERKAYLARLPSKILRSTRTIWARTVKEILEEEGIPWNILPRKAPYRPLIVEPCRRSCKIHNNEIVTLWITLPRGLYATIYVRSKLNVDWFKS